MNKKLILIAILIGMLLIFSPFTLTQAKGLGKCGITAHESAMVITDHYLANAKDPNHYIVKDGGSLDLSNVYDKTVFIEKGGDVIGGGDHLLFVQQGGHVQAHGFRSTVYYEDEESLVYVNSDADVVKCGVLVFFDPHQDRQTYCILPVDSAALPVKEEYNYFSDDPNEVTKYIKYILLTTTQWVKDGGYLGSSLHPRINFVEKGGEARSMGLDNVFVKAGGTYDSYDDNGATIYFQKGSVLKNLSKNDDLVRCDVMEFYPEFEG